MQGFHDKRLTLVITLLIIHGKNSPGQSPLLDLMDRLGAGGGWRGAECRGLLLKYVRAMGKTFPSRDNHKNKCKIAPHWYGVCMCMCVRMCVCVRDGRGVFICNSSYNTFTLSRKLANNSPRGRPW